MMFFPLFLCKMISSKAYMERRDFLQVIENTLKQVDSSATLDTCRPVSGGDINEAYYVRTDTGEFFVKMNRQVAASFFEFEKKGLEKIGAAGVIDVPKVYSITVDPETNTPALWMEWISGEKNKQTDNWLGERLAALHQKEGEKFGWHGTSFIGKLEQDNRWSDDWLSYYRDFRIGGQLELGRARGTITGKREKKLVQLMEQLDRWIPINPVASLLHGDLWGGNWMTGKGGNPYLIDPSVLYGDHEFELSFTELFGGFSAAFYDAYQSVFPLSDTYEDRKPLYQLYYLLVHLNMFGETYGGSVDRILNRYVG